MYRLLMLVLGIAAFLTTGAPAADKDTEKKDAAKALARLLELTPEQFIKRFDKNNDGALQKDELPPRLAQAFDRFDKNNDGKLDRAEVEAMLAAIKQRLANSDKKPDDKTKKPDDKKKTDDKKPDDAQVERFVDRMLERLDKNKDGKISKDEAMGPLAEAFDRLDTNKDGFLDRDELRRSAARLLAMQGGGPGGRPGTPRGPDFDSFDKDADGRLTRDEVKGTPIESLFDAMDTNKDGKLSRKEFDAFYRKQAEKEKQTEKAK